jgi:hypothetical protein
MVHFCFLEVGNSDFESRWNDNQSQNLGRENE